MKLLSFICEFDLMLTFSCSFFFEVLEFEKSLSSHQRVTHGDWSLLHRAVIEHNFTAVSKIFTNITFEQLARLLDIDRRQVP